jgi:predicted esterase
VLILHGEADQTIPIEEAYQLQKLLENRVAGRDYSRPAL